MEQIIPKKPISVEHNWQKELALSFTDPVKLLQHLGLDPEKYAQHIKARRLFPMRVPRHFADLMEKGNPSDPLFLQVMPLSDEFLTSPGYSEQTRNLEKYTRKNIHQTTKVKTKKKKKKTIT